VLSLLSVKAWGQSAARPIGLCTANETSYFSCQTARAQWISLCGEPDGLVQYRFGKLGKIELRFPAGDDRKQTLRFSHYFRYQVDRFEVTFEIAGVDYAVFDSTEGARRERGVSVTKPNQPDVSLKCVGRGQSRMIDLEPLLPCDPDNALSSCSH
jgi:hypothetical protein